MRTRLLFSSAVAGLLCWGGVSVGRAQCPSCLAYTVNSTGDGHQVGPSNICDDGMGHCTLRAAIEAANLHSGDDAILFNIPTSDPNYNGTSWVITPTQALPDLASNITISGPGAAQLIVKGNANGNGFRVFNVTATGTVTISGITISQAVLQTAGLHGAGIQNVNAGTVNITDCVLRNVLSVSNGGGVYNDTGIVNISGTTFQETNTNSNGGGVYNGSGTVNITNCYFVSNNAHGSNGTGAMGGAIANSSGKVNVTNSLVYGCVGDQGSVVNFFTGGVISLANCTFYLNEAQAGGGAITATNGTVNLTNCTVVGNFISNSANGGAGGISVTSPGIVNVKSTLIAKNTATGFNVWPEVSGTFVSQGFNLVGNTAGSDGFNKPTDHTGTSAGGTPLDPKIDPNGLQDNGGPTKTIALLSGSPAIDNGIAGVNPVTNAPLTTDQRGNGFARTFNDPNITNPGDGTDIGAFEVQTAFPPPSPTPSATPTATPTTLANVSTRLPVLTGDNALFAGFIITGTQPKNVLLVGLGPSIGIPGTLADPTLELYDSSSGQLLESNDNWVDSPNKAAIMNTGAAPPNNLESAIVRSLPASPSGNGYTAILRGVNNGTGIGVVEVFDLDRTVNSKFANIATRGLVQTGDSVLFAGTIVLGQASQRILICALGPSVPVPGNLSDPILELHDGSGTLMEANDNWVDSPNKQAIIDSGAAPSNNLESAIIRLVPAATGSGANYTAIVRGVNGSTGIAVIEVFALP